MAFWDKIGLAPDRKLFMSRPGARPAGCQLHWGQHGPIQDVAWWPVLSWLATSCRDHAVGMSRTPDGNMSARWRCIDGVSRHLVAKQRQMMGTLKVPPWGSVTRDCRFGRNYTSDFWQISCGVVQRQKTPKNAWKRPETPQLTTPTIFAEILTTPKWPPWYHQNGEWNHRSWTSQGLVMSIPASGLHVDQTAYLHRLQNTK